MATTGAKTNLFENLLLNHLFRGNATAPDTSLFIGLVTGDPTVNDANAGSWHSTHEVVINSGYSRQPLAYPTLSAASDGVITTASEINFGTSNGAAGWGNVTGFFISTTTGAGDTYYYGIFDTMKSVAIGDSVRITAGNLTITEQ